MNKKIIAVIVCVFMLTSVFVGCLPNDTKPEVNQGDSGNADSDSKAAEDKGEANADARVLKISNGVNDKHPAYIAQVEVFKKMVEEQTDGRYKIEVYHSNQLGDDVKATEALRAGTLAMTCTSTAPLVGIEPQLAVFDIPFLFRDEKVADAVLDGEIGDYLSSLMPDKGVVNLAWWENGFRHLTNSVKPVSSPADLKGMKIRTMENKFHLAAWRELGANPTPMSWSEVFIALEQKAMDGQENPVPNFYSAKIHEVNPYITLTGHVYAPFMFLFSKKIWDTIPEEDQEIFKAAAIEAGLKDRELNREATVKNLEQIKEEGGTVVELTAEEKKAFQDATASVWDLVEEQVGSDLINQLKEEMAKVE